MANITDVSGRIITFSDGAASREMEDSDINVYDWNEIDFNGLVGEGPDLYIDRSGKVTTMSDKTGKVVAITDKVGKITTMTDSGASSHTTWGSATVTWGDSNFTWGGYRV